MGIGPAKTLQKFSISTIGTLAGVGQNMVDHPGFSALFSINAVSQHRLWNTTHSAEAEKQYETNRSSPLTAFASNYLLWEQFPEDAGLSPATRAAIGKFPVDWPDFQHIFNAAGSATNTSGDFLSVGVVILKPSSRDAAENPVVDVGWFNSETELEIGIGGLKRARLFANATGVVIREVTPGTNVQTDVDIKSYIKSAASPSHHAVGTCKMGYPDDESTVVNTHGCVLGGVSSLRVIDSISCPYYPLDNPCPLRNCGDVVSRHLIRASLLKHQRYSFALVPVAPSDPALFRSLVQDTPPLFFYMLHILRLEWDILLVTIALHITSITTKSTCLHAQSSVGCE
ncbi:Cyclase atC [Cladobotryum mycophilum]|uniref:Cyclase atC n=1 Tax=Cladobotryum mycophilum TaxID=491253 RepID=A0ABR0S9K4_9HYPO